MKVQIELCVYDQVILRFGDVVVKMSRRDFAEFVKMATDSKKAFFQQSMLSAS